MSRSLLERILDPAGLERLRRQLFFSPLWAATEKMRALTNGPAPRLSALDVAFAPLKILQTPAIPRPSVLDSATRILDLIDVRRMLERLDAEDVEVLRAGPTTTTERGQLRRWRQAIWRLTSSMGPKRRRKWTEADYTLFIRALALATKDAQERRRVRLGTSYVKDGRGQRPAEIVPTDKLSTRELYSFLRARAYTRIPGGRRRSSREANSGRRSPAPTSEIDQPPRWRPVSGSEARMLAAIVTKVGSPRQREIYQLMREGWSLAQIAKRLGRASSAVRVQWMRLRRKLPATSAV